MKNILFIELCNYKDYPLGGHLSFAIHLATAMKGEIDLVGMRTDDQYPVGKWSDCEYCGYKYHFFNIENKKVSYKKPLIPGRVTSYFTIKKYIKEILVHKAYDIIIVQTPEVLLSMPKQYLSKICLIMPGVANPLKISRYKWARLLASQYDKVFFSYAQHVQVILPASDKKAIEEFIERSKGTVNNKKVKQFLTRYDANIFKPIPKNIVRKELDVAEDELMLVTSGRLNWYKGWKFMIDALQFFVKYHSNAKLYFIGKGEDEQKIRDYVAECKMEEHVVLASVHPLPVVAKYLNAADIFIMGSYFEGWSTALVEAIACANPCVVTNFSSAHDLIKNGENGYVQDERDEKNFAMLLENAIKLDKTVVNKYAENAYSMSVQTMRDQLNKILNFE